MPEIKFTVPGVPKAWSRARRCGNIYFSAPQMVSYKSELKYFFLKAVGCLFKPLDCPIRLTMHAFFPMPKSAPKKDRVVGTRRKISKPDLDNLEKIIGDGLNRIAWKDDAQIYSITAEKSETTGSPALHVKIEWDTTDTPATT
jgi:Holliday junction resolvase RusA-like endonuclease